MTPDPKSLAVLLDAMCAAYGYTREQAEEAEKYARNIEAVRELLKHTPSTERYDEEACPSCEAIHDTYGTARSIHSRTCPVAAAWRALGDPRAAADIERAHEEALRERERRPLTPEEAHARRFLSGWSGNDPRFIGLAARGPVNGANRGDLVEATWGLPTHDLHAHRYVDRAISDARGMEVVEDEAHREDLARDAESVHGALLRSAGREPFVP